MAPTLYYMDRSPPCRSVRMMAKAVGLELNLVPTDPLNGETRTKEFLAINPQHTIPTLVDEDITLWESRAILQYLANQYGCKDKKLYPKDAVLRAQVDRMLYFDFGTLGAAFLNFILPVMLHKEKPESENLAKIHEALALLDQYLEGHFFAVGNRLTIADYALVVSASSCEAIGVELLQYKNVKRWLTRCKEQMPGYLELNEKPCENISKMFKTKMRI
uniref:Glutathione S-transferase 1-like n=1 Tax=Hirondellea gigas TaxID=1518452 RepID=A0A2P2I8K8_9CRUS